MGADLHVPVGVLLGRLGGADVVDASVVVRAHMHDSTMVTSDAGDLRRLDPSLCVETI